MHAERFDERMGILLSGGVDSAVLLEQLIQHCSQVVPFYVRTGCVWEQVELAAVRRFLSAINRKRVASLVEFDVPVGDLYGEHWSLSGANVPDDESADEAVFMPGRNPLLLIKPALWCQKHGIRQLALATLANNPFDDATPNFCLAFEEMVRQATGARVEIVRPFSRLRKDRVMALGRHLPLELTFSCLAPIDGQHCGQCNKCAERALAFRQINLEDATHYSHLPRQAIAR